MSNGRSKLFLFSLMCMTAVCFDTSAARRRRPPALSPVSATVEYIFDGDTFRATVNMPDDIDIDVRVRMMNIDAPEMSGQCDDEIKMAHSARDRLAELIPVGSVVTLSNIKDDKYLGRIDANVMTADGTDVSGILISEKLVRRYDGGKRAGWCD